MQCTDRFVLSEASAVVSMRRGTLDTVTAFGLLMKCAAPR